MKLHIIGTGSKGNSYILQNDSEALLLEAGCNFAEVKKALGFNLRKVAGCLITHEHGDHAKFIENVAKASIDTYSHVKTFEALKVFGHRYKAIEPMRMLEIGRFRVLPFEVKHDAAAPLGFLINHPDTGNVLFLTDTMYSPYTFEGLNNIIVEANYSTEIIKRKCDEQLLPIFLRDRVIKSHLSFENCTKLLLANDLTKVNNIVLIHLSDGNSDEAMFKDETEKQTGKLVTVARNGMVIDFNKTPF